MQLKIGLDSAFTSGKLWLIKEFEEGDESVQWIKVMSLSSEGDESVQWRWWVCPVSEVILGSRQSFL